MDYKSCYNCAYYQRSSNTRVCNFNETYLYDDMACSNWRTDGKFPTEDGGEYVDTITGIIQRIEKLERAAARTNRRLRRLETAFD